MTVGRRKHCEERAAAWAERHGLGAAAEEGDQALQVSKLQETASCKWPITWPATWPATGHPATPCPINLPDGGVVLPGRWLGKARVGAAAAVLLLRPAHSAVAELDLGPGEKEQAGTAASELIVLLL